MRTWHVYARHHNFGDYALGLGLRTLFEQYFAVPTVFELHRNGRLFPPNYLHESWLDYLYWDTELEP